MPADYWVITLSGSSCNREHDLGKTKITRQTRYIHQCVMKPFCPSAVPAGFSSYLLSGPSETSRAVAGGSERCWDGMVWGNFPPRIPKPPQTPHAPTGDSRSKGAGWDGWAFPAPATQGRVGAQSSGGFGVILRGCCLGQSFVPQDGASAEMQH